MQHKLDSVEQVASVVFFVNKKDYFNEYPDFFVRSNRPMDVFVELGKVLGGIRSRHIQFCVCVKYLIETYVNIYLYIRYIFMTTYSKHYVYDKLMCMRVQRVRNLASGRKSSVRDSSANG